MFAHGTERRLVSAQTSALVHRIHEIILAHLVRTEQHLASAGTTTSVHRIHEIILAHLVRTEEHLASAGTTSVLQVPPFGRLAANIRIRYDLVSFN
jgi:hypothetical protein